MTARHVRVLLYNFAEDGTIELPDGAVIISLVFESEGPHGFQSRVAAAWVEVPATTGEETRQGAALAE